MISILCPTRNRPNEFNRMVNTACGTASDANNIEILAYVDEDDRTVLPNFGNVKVKRGPRQILTKCWNELIPLASGDIFMQGNDDIVFKTKNWDLTVEAAFAASTDKVWLMHGDDLAFGRDKAGAHPFVHRKWIDALGYFIAPYFVSDYGDTWNNEIANLLGRRRFLPIEIEHLHHMAGKAKVDQTTLDRLERHRADEVDKLYQKLLPERLNDLARLQALLRKPIWSILVLTQESRQKKYLPRLLEGLSPQLVDRPVELLFRRFDKDLDLGTNRELLRRQARGEFLCFVDDDDVLADNYVAKILPVLQKNTVDYVGFNVQCYMDGTPLPVTRHSLRYPDWGNDSQGAYRDISHLNPIRKEIALLCPMEGGFAEDNRWAQALRAKGVLKKEKYINEVLYKYYSRSVKDDDPPQRPGEPKQTKSYGKEWRPTHHMCPQCRSTCVVLFSNGLRCNQCGHQFQ